MFFSLDQYFYFQIKEKSIEQIIEEDLNFINYEDEEMDRKRKIKEME